MGDDTVDQTLKTLKTAAKHSSSSSAEWSLPTWLWTVLVLFAGFWAMKAYTAIAFKNKQGRYKLCVCFRSGTSKGKQLTSLEVVYGLCREKRRRHG